jgi:ribulose-phosphate 3-epimerase
LSSEASTDGTAPMGRATAKRAVQLAASLMCADLLHLADELDRLHRAGVDRWHYDVMDGHFVPNLTMGPDLLARVRYHSNLPVDVHLMVERPEVWVETFARAGANRIFFHIEATHSPHRLALTIRSLGCAPGVAVNAATHAHFPSLLPLVDAVLFLSVDPGFAGQPLLPGAVERIAAFAQEHSGVVSVGADGHVDAATARRLAGVGVDHLVLGTTALFRPGVDYATAIRQMREAVSVRGVSA